MQQSQGTTDLTQPLERWVATAVMVATVEPSSATAETAELVAMADTAEVEATVRTAPISSLRATPDKTVETAVTVEPAVAVATVVTAVSQLAMAPREPWALAETEGLVEMLEPPAMAAMARMATPAPQMEATVETVGTQAYLVWVD